MRKIIVSINVTPDGFCDHRAVIADEELHGFANELLRNADSVLFGRVTYQLFENYRPLVAKNKTGSKSTIEFAELIDTIDKIVFSKTLKNADPIAPDSYRGGWKNTTVIQEISKDAILKLKQKHGKDIVLSGSPGIIEQLIKLELIDTCYFLVQPMIFGNGKHFFEKRKPYNRFNLKPADSKTFKSGVISLCYQA